MRVISAETDKSHEYDSFKGRGGDVKETQYQVLKNYRDLVTKKNLQIKSNQKKEEQSEEKSGSFIFKISRELQCESANQRI